MKKTVTILLAAFFLTTVFAGCGRKNEETWSIHNRNYGDSHRQGEEAANVIVLSEKITELTDGLNEMGLAVSVNMIQDNATIEQNTDKKDITTTTAVRLLLDQAADVEEVQRTERSIFYAND